MTDDAVLVLREKWIDDTFHDYSEIEIPYENIEDVEVVPGGVVNGYICIVESDCAAPSNIFKAMKNDNTVIFRMFSNGKAERFADALRSRI